MQDSKATKIPAFLVYTPSQLFNQTLIYVNNKNKLKTH